MIPLVLAPMLSETTFVNVLIVEEKELISNDEIVFK